MDINIIGACQTLGCGRDGVQYGPDSLRENNLLNKLINRIHAHRSWLQSP
jgi:hypothetical protein